MLFGAAMCWGTGAYWTWLGLQDTTWTLLVGAMLVARCAMFATVRQTQRTPGDPPLKLWADIRASSVPLMLLLCVLSTEWAIWTAAVAWTGAVLPGVASQLTVPCFAVVSLLPTFRRSGSITTAVGSDVRRTLVMLLVGFAGAGLVVYARYSGHDEPVHLLGALFAVGTPVMSGLAIAAQNLIARQTRERHGGSDLAASARAINVGYACYAATGVVMLIWTGVNVAFGGTATFGWRGVLCVVGLIVCVPAGNMLLHVANIRAVDRQGLGAGLAANVTMFVEPVFAVLLLVLLAETHIARWDLLVAGLAVIVVAVMFAKRGTKRATTTTT